MRQLLVLVFTLLLIAPVLAQEQKKPTSIYDVIERKEKALEKKYSKLTYEHMCYSTARKDFRREDRKLIDTEILKLETEMSNVREELKKYDEYWAGVNERLNQFVKETVKREEEWLKAATKRADEALKKLKEKKKKLKKEAEKKEIEGPPNIIPEIS